MRLPSFELAYEVEAQRPPLKLSGTSTLRYERTGSAYRFSADIDGGPLYGLRQESRGVLQGGAFQPRHYQETSARRGTQEARIDAVQRQVQFGGGDAVELPERWQDRLSALLQLGRDVARNAAPRTFTQGIVGPRHVSTYRIEVQAREALELPAGRFEAVRVLRRRDDGDDDRLELWFAPALCWLPVQLRFVEGRQTIEQRLGAARFGTAPR